jgi:hypothetical protein
MCYSVLVSGFLPHVGLSSVAWLTTLNYCGVGEDRTGVPGWLARVVAVGGFSCASPSRWSLWMVVVYGGVVGTRLSESTRVIVLMGRRVLCQTGRGTL